MNTCKVGGVVGVTCTDCQMDIGGHHGLNSQYCTTREKCGSSACPAFLTHYNTKTQMCEETKKNIYECKKRHSLSWDVSAVQMLYTISLLECLHTCISYIDVICRAVDYNEITNLCHIFNVNKHTVPAHQYTSSYC